MTDAALNATATRLFFNLALAGAANVLHERRAQNSGDPVLGDDAAQLVRGDAEQREIKQAEFARQSVLLRRNSGQRRCSREKERQQRGVFREQRFVAFLLFFRLGAVFLD
jgi:hypothetical protein